MIVEVLLSQRQVLDCPRKLAVTKLKELIDPDPSHAGSTIRNIRRLICELPCVRGCQETRDRFGTIRARQARPNANWPLGTSANASMHSVKSGSQLALDILDKHINRVKVADSIDGRILFQAREVRE